MGSNKVHNCREKKWQQSAKTKTARQTLQLKDKEWDTEREREKEWKISRHNVLDVFLPSLRYQPFNGFGNTSTVHSNRTWLSTGAPTTWLTAFTLGGTDCCFFLWGRKERKKEVVYIKLKQRIENKKQNTQHTIKTHNCSCKRSKVGAEFARKIESKQREQTS